MQLVKIFLTQFIYTLHRNIVLSGGIGEMMMRNFLFAILFLLFTSSTANAVNMVKVENYLKNPLQVIGMPDFPPFAYYDKTTENVYNMHSVFLNPLINTMKKYGVKVSAPEINEELANDVRLLLVKAKGGEAQVFIGAYADTKLFSGLEVIYPAVISNPIHLITLPETQSKIRNINDLSNLRGIASKSEYFSDFVLRKFREMNVTYVDSPYEAYEKIITGQADYMLGSMYYNRIMASRYGVGDYISYSKNPIFKIPFFIALSKVMPLLSEYQKVLKEEFENPEFAILVKQEIIRAVNAEVEKNAGIVPPSFVQQIVVQTEENDIFDTEDIETGGGRIIQKEVHQKTIDEVLEGI